MDGQRHLTPSWKKFIEHKNKRNFYTHDLEDPGGDSDGDSHGYGYGMGIGIVIINQASWTNVDSMGMDF